MWRKRESVEVKEKVLNIEEEKKRKYRGGEKGVKEQRK